MLAMALARKKRAYTTGKVPFPDQHACASCPRLMTEDVIASIAGRDKAVPLGYIEPLYGATVTLT
jgi:hypothetical protein